MAAKFHTLTGEDLTSQAVCLPAGCTPLPTPTTAAAADMLPLSKLPALAPGVLRALPLTLLLCSAGVTCVCISLTSHGCRSRKQETSPRKQHIAGCVKGIATAVIVVLGYSLGAQQAHLPVIMLLIRGHRHMI
jgi:hypothetical protein